MKTIVIFGSSRSDGNTRQIVDYFTEKTGIEAIDLNEKNIGYYDYDYRNQDDDFIPMMEKVVTYDLIIFVTPVYWYSMSAVMKTSFDRLSDLLSFRKDLGYQLKGKSMALISCSGHDDLVEGFSMPFKESANYLNMDYLGEIHTWIDDKTSKIHEKAQTRLDKFIEKVSYSVK